jgi:hypothetical protein
MEMEEAEPKGETRVCRIVKDGGWNGFLTMLGSLDHIPKGEVIQEC